jgi:hypothetical protein
MARAYLRSLRKAMLEATNVLRDSYPVLLVSDRSSMSSDLSWLLYKSECHVQ